MSPGALERKMCNSSVEPTPSRMSTPKRAFQALPTDSGSASPAEVQMRSRLPARVVLQRLVVEHRGKQRRHAEEDARVVFVHQREHRSRRRPLGSSAPWWRRPTSETSARCRGHRRRTVLPPKGRRRPRECRAPAWRRFPPSRRDWNAGAARPWACRSSPTNRARTPARRDGSPPSQTNRFRARVRRRVSCGRARRCRRR